MNAKPRFVVAYSLAALISAASGCAGFKLPDLSAQQDGVSREERKKEAVRRFDESRELAEFEAAAAAGERGDARTCEETLQRLLGRNPKHRDARLLMADVCLAGDRREEAFTHLQAALQAHPDDAQVLYAMAVLLDAANRRDEALAYYQRAAQQEPDNELFAVGYHTARDGGRQSPIGGAGAETATDASTTLRVKPVAQTPQAVASDRDGSVGPVGGEAVQALFQRAGTALQQDAPEAALVFFREAAGKQPNNPQIPISAATMALRHNHPDVAVELLTPAERRFADSAALRRILGVAYYRLGDYRASQVALQQALSLDKSSALTYFLMGCTLAKLGQSEAAGTHFRQAEAIDPRYAARR
jgi:tetratricopeptide (TPR) repeat protein